MPQSNAAPLDLVEELRLRRWAREHYVAAEERDAAWHPVVLAEMRLKQADLSIAESLPPAIRYVPLVDSRMIHGPHQLTAPHFAAALHRTETLHYT